MFVATLSEHLVCNRLFFTLVQPIGIFICGSVLFIFVRSNTSTLDSFIIRACMCMSISVYIGVRRCDTYMCVGKCLSCVWNVVHCAMCRCWGVLVSFSFTSCICMCATEWVSVNRMQRVRTYECIFVRFVRTKLLYGIAFGVGVNVVVFFLRYDCENMENATTSTFEQISARVDW